MSTTPPPHLAPGRAQRGFTLLELLVVMVMTFVSWRQLRALRGHTARRLLVFLEAERFTGTYRRTVDQALLATLGITATRPHHQRATLRRAAQEISANPNRYQRVAVVPGERRDTYLLVAERVRADQGSSCDARGQSVR